MIGDNLSSHISLNVIQQCQQHDISFVLLPPNSTHILQPLDVSFFKPLKSAWRNVLLEWKKFSRGAISKDVFPALLKETLDKIKASQSQNIKSGFRATGIIPFDPQHVLSKLSDTEWQFSSLVINIWRNVANCSLQKHNFNNWQT